MGYHLDKCVILRVTKPHKPLETSYTLHGHQQEVVDHVTFLGVEISNDLSWNRYVNTLKTKANNTLGFIRSNIQTTSIKANTVAYESLVWPQLEYSTTVWHPHTPDLNNSLEMVSVEQHDTSCTSTSAQPA